MSTAVRRRLTGWLLPEHPPAAPVGILVALAIIAAETATLALLHATAPTSTPRAAIYLLGVLVVAGVWGVPLGLATAVTSAAAFNYFHLPPPGLHLNPHEDIPLTLIFVTSALLASGLASLARSNAAEARLRAEEAESLLAEQAALRRVATMVAAGGPPAQVFAAVTAELHHLFRGFSTALIRYERDGTVIAVSERDEHGTLFPDRPNLPITGENVVGRILRTRRPAHIDYDSASGPIADRVRAVGVHRGLGVPIIVAGDLWGVALVMSSRRDPVPPDAEARLSAFTGLVATAIANAENGAELVASRSRLVAAADEARRRIERDLHDGAQQRIIALALKLRLVDDGALEDPAAVQHLLSDTVHSLTEIHQCLSDLARGIHPALLIQGGICPMLRTLARRSTVPVDLDLCVDRRLPERVEVAAYYVVSEALTNIAKHANATLARVGMTADDRCVWLTVRDDGTGGADPAGGTGLIGLRDRVAALGGRLSVTSSPADGTTLTAAIPLVEPAVDAATISTPTAAA
ncbi:DUF4118 domain-containing protein [Dactylosporangium sp. NPDC049140]|uniref:sensor histidine kinase n=1 Tax=Dactylosporangium sp. NPDC049140 TaxID=3155647 RepID=UPI0034045448